MTQDVQPLTWQKRTNLEEHQQFFSKINEIIANLAPTVDEAEAAIAQATQAIASANAAINTANAASANADAASQQAQTAATTVAGYNARLTTAEGDIDTNAADITALQSRMGTAEGKIGVIEADYLKKTGAAQTVTSQIMVPTTATGVRDTQIANGTRIQNDLDNYAPMARLSDYQVFDGIKIFDGVPGATNARNSGIDIATPPSNETIVGQWVALDKNNQEIAKMLAVVTPTGSAYANMLVRNSDGTFKAVRIATGD